MTETTTTETTAKPAAPWVFEAVTLGEAVGTFTVHAETGRWAQTIQIETGVIGRGVYVYDATFVSADGATTTKTSITREDLLRLRRWAKAAATREAN